MLAGTQYLTENLAPVPLLWVLLLSVYLLSFILCFDRRSWYRPALFLRLTILAPFSPWRGSSTTSGFALTSPLAIWCSDSGCFWSRCTATERWSGRGPRPEPPDALLSLIAAGGALGGLLVGLVSPWLLPLPVDFPLALLATALLTAVMGSPATRLMRWVSLRRHRSGGGRHRASLRPGLRIDNLARHARASMARFGSRARWSACPPPRRAPWSTESSSTARRLVEEQLTLTPTTYFAVGSGVERAIERLRHPGERVGIIGLGVGTLAAYGDHRRCVPLLRDQPAGGRCRHALVQLPRR